MVRKIPGGGHDNPLQYSCLEKPMDGGTWRTSLEGHKQSDVDLAAEHTCRLLNGMLGNQQKTMVDVDLTSA